MTTKTITIHVNDEPVEVLIGSAKKADGILRAELKMKAIQMEDSNLRKQAAFFLYPTCIAAVRGPESVHSMSLDDFMTTVDEADVDEWMKTATELNPQWLAADKALAEMTAEQEKKTEISEPGSQPLTAV